MKSTEQILAALKAAKPELAERFAIERVALFGSYAKGTQHPDSDVDILFDADQQAFYGLKQTLDLHEYLEQLFGVAKVDVVNSKYINPVIELDIEDSLIYV